MASWVDVKSVAMCSMCYLASTVLHAWLGEQSVYVKPSRLLIHYAQRWGYMACARMPSWMGYGTGTVTRENFTGRCSIGKNTRGGYVRPTKIKQRYPEGARCRHLKKLRCTNSNEDSDCNNGGYNGLL